MRKPLKHLFIGTGLALVLLFTTASILTSVYKKELVAYVSEQLGRYVETPFEPLEAEWHVFSTFPHIGVTFRHLRFNDTLNGETFPVLEAGKVKIIFNFWRMITGDIVIRKILVEDGLFRDHKDYGIIRKLKLRKQDGKPNGTAGLSVSEIELVNVLIDSENRIKGNAVKILVKRASGDFETGVNGHFRFPDITGELQLFRTGNIDLLQHEPFSINGNIKINGAAGTTEFNSGTGRMAGLSVKVNGLLKAETDTSKRQYLRIGGQGNSTDFLRAFLPDILKNDLFSTDSSHTLVTLTSIGTIGPVNKPDAHISFEMRNGRIQAPHSGEGLTHITMRGTVAANASTGTRKAHIRLQGSMKGYFKKLDLLNPPPEYKALFSRYSTPVGQKDSSSKTTGHSRLPDQVDFSVELQVDTLIYKKAMSTAVSFTARIDHQRVQVEKLKGKAFGGTFVLNSLFTNPAEGQYNILLNARFSQINIHALFEGFENFNQDYIRSPHLKGRASLQLDARTTLNASFEPSVGATEVKATATLHKPEIIRWPLLSDALVLGLKKQAEHLYLDNSRIDFVIRNKILYISPFEVNSNLTRFEVSAIQEYGQNLELIMRVNLADQLLNSADKRTKEIKTGREQTKKRDWGFVHLQVSGRPKDLKFDLLKKETYNQSLLHHRRSYQAAAKKTGF